MSKKILAIIIALILISIIVVGIYMSNSEDIVTLDLVSLNTQISETRKL